MDLENNSPRLIEHHRGKGFTNNFRYSTKNNNSAGYAFQSCIVRVDAFENNHISNAWHGDSAIGILLRQCTSRGGNVKHSAGRIS